MTVSDRSWIRSGFASLEYAGRGAQCARCARTGPGTDREARTLVASRRALYPPRPREADAWRTQHAHDILGAPHLEPGQEARAQFLEDRDGYRYELRYIRDKEKREVDFALLRENKVVEIYEAKWNDSTPSRSLEYYAEMLKPLRAYQIVGPPCKPWKRGTLEVIAATDLFTSAWQAQDPADHK